MKSSNIGGQAVLEGIMMKNGEKYAVAVRKPDGDITVDVQTYKSVVPWKKLTEIPFVRGAFNFVDSMVLGVKTLMFSASFYEEEEETEEITEEQQAKKEKQESLLMGITVACAVVLALGIFMVLPYFISMLLNRFISSQTAIIALEGVVRLLLFIGYILLISKMKDIQRTFMYHGAEHKCINCIEHGLELNVDNVRRSSKEHKRCGTSFLLFVMIISCVLLFIVQVESHLLRVVVRILLIPVIAGIAYEFIKLAGRSDNPVVTVISKPGLWMQALTTKEPDDDMIEVAIEAVESVFDWKAYQEEAFGE